MVLIAAAGHAQGGTASGELDLTAIPLEQLLDLEVDTAAKLSRQVSDAPSAVTVVTSDDIRAYGYRTLGEVLNSMRGLFTFNDRAYDSLAGRGYGNPGNFVGRIMVLIDGYQANDNLYQSTFIGNDGMLDVALIDRVEYISGPNATTYGNNAFFGIINIVTKGGRDFDALQVAGETGSYGQRTLRTTYGNRFENGADLLLSYSGHHADGQSLYFPEFDAPATNNGIARNLDEERNRRFFGKLSWPGWTLEALRSSARKQLPAAPYGTDFNASPAYYEDSNTFVSLRHDEDIGHGLKLSTHGYYGDYAYRGAFTFGGVPWRESAIGRWAGVDAKFAASWFENHKLVFGAEYRSDYQRKQTTPAARSDHPMWTFSLYAQDEITLRQDLALHLGIRLDDNREHSASLSPRVALIYNVTPATTLKLTHATAYRTASAADKYYDDGGGIVPNPGLDQEHIRTYEMVLEHRLGPHARLLGTLYHYSTQSFINSVEIAPGVLQSVNQQGGHSDGGELEFEQNFDNGIRLRTSYAYQHAEDGNGSWEANSPRHLGKFNLTVPLLQNLLRAGIEVGAMSERKTMQGTKQGGHAITNLTFTSDHWIPNVDLSLSIRNLFDRDYADVAPVQNVQAVIPQNGRNWWLQLSYDFK